MFSPLDDELELGTERFDPWLTESIVLLGTITSFEQVPVVVDRLTRVAVKPETARRLTEAVGRAQVERETVEAEDLRHRRESLPRHAAVGVPQPRPHDRFAHWK